MKILLIGKTGQLGGSLIALNDKHEIYAPSREMVDIDLPETIENAIYNFRPDLVINTAAFHNVPLCETQPEQAFKTNCLAVNYIAKACKRFDARLITFSTDYVFGGEKNTPYTEYDKPNPLQIYGISRLAGEHAVMAIAPENSIIIRTCGLYGLAGAASKGGNFVDKRIEDAKPLSKFEMGCDQMVSPTFTDDLAVAVLKLIEKNDVEGGIYHLVNHGQCTWYEFTKAIYQIMNVDSQVVPVDRKGMSGEMRRPRYSVLANTRAKMLGIELPHWHDALERYLKSKYNFNHNSYNATR